MNTLNDLFLEAEKTGRKLVFMRLNQSVFQTADPAEVAAILKNNHIDTIVLTCDGPMEACIRLAAVLVKECGMNLILESNFHKLYRYTLGRWARETTEAGICGIHVPDLPMEEQNQLRVYLLEAEGADILSEIDPSSGDRIVEVMETAKGCLWATKYGNMDFLSELPGDPYTYFLFAAEAVAKLPMILDFNINSPDDVDGYEMNMDGFVIGDALNRYFAAEGYNKDMLEGYLKRFA